MEILEAFALTNSYRVAGELVGCSYHTVEYWVTMRDKGLLPDGHAAPRIGLAAPRLLGPDRRRSSIGVSLGFHNSCSGLDL